MVELCPLKVGLFLAKIGYFGHIFGDLDFKFVLPTIVINIKEETQLESQLDQN